MSETSTVCRHCGAPIKRRGAQACEFCGYEFPRADPGQPAVEVEPAGTPPPGVFGDLEQRFAALKAHPEYESARSQRPSAAKVVAKDGSRALWLAFFAVACFVVGMLMSKAGPNGKLMAAMPFAMGVFAIFGALRQASRAGSAPRAPAKVFDAVIVKEVVQPTGEHGPPPFVFLTLQSADGERRQLRATREVAGPLTRGDLGVAFQRADYLLGFRRLPC